LSPPPNATAQTNIYSFGKNLPFFFATPNQSSKKHDSFLGHEALRPLTSRSSSDLPFFEIFIPGE
jgi:hypothetical protein